MPLSRRLAAEFLGTFWLVLCGCGAAVLASTFPSVGIGLLGVSLAFGLAVLTMAYAVGQISGGHFNPAVTVGLWLGGRSAGRDVPAYVVTQVLAAVAGAVVLFLIADGAPGFEARDGFAANGYGEHSPGGFGLAAAFLTELVFTAGFVLVILAVTGQRALRSLAPLPIGLALTLIHLVTIPVTNTSVNPARSTGPALFAGGEALGQLWLFWLAPLLGAAVAGLLSRFVIGEPEPEPDPEPAAGEPLRSP